MTATETEIQAMPPPPALRWVPQDGYGQAYYGYDGDRRTAYILVGADEDGREWWQAATRPDGASRDGVWAGLEFRTREEAQAWCAAKTVAPTDAEMGTAWALAVRAGMDSARIPDLVVALRLYEYYKAGLVVSPRVGELPPAPVN